VGHEQLVLLLLVQLGARLGRLVGHLDGLGLEPVVGRGVEVGEGPHALVDHLLPLRLPRGESLLLLGAPHEEVGLLEGGVLQHAVLLRVEEALLLLPPAEQHRVGLDELGPDALLVLECLDALPLLLLEVRRRLLLHDLALALDLAEPRVVDVPLLRDLLLAHLAHELPLLLLLLVAHVLLRVHAADRLLLLLVEALLGRQLAPLEHLLQLELPLALLHHVGVEQLGVQRLDAVRRVVEHLVGTLDRQPPLLHHERLLLGVNLLAQRLLHVELILTALLLPLAVRLEGVGPLGLARVRERVQPRLVLLLLVQLQARRARADLHGPILGGAEHRREGAGVRHGAGHSHGALVRIAEERLVHIRRVRHPPAEGRESSGPRHGSRV